MIAIRGATTVEHNEKTEILAATREMIETIISRNGLNIDDIISAMFTCTKDLDAVYPAVSARELGIVNAALSCTAEMYVAGSLAQCIRVTVYAESGLRQRDAMHVYLKGAKALRPDIVG